MLRVRADGVRSNEPRKIQDLWNLGVTVQRTHLDDGDVRWIAQGDKVVLAELKTYSEALGSFTTGCIRSHGAAGSTPTSRSCSSTATSARPRRGSARCVGHTRVQVDVASATNLSSASMWAIKHEKWWRWVDAADVAWLLGGEGSQPTDGRNGTDRTLSEEGAATASPKAKGSRFQMKPRRQADSIKKELVNLDQRREALGKLLGVYEELDVLDQQGRNSNQNTPQGTRSLRGAVLEVLCEAERPLRPKEIWIRAQELGAATRSKNPAAVVDLTAYQLQQSGVPIEKRDKAWSGDRRKLSVHLEKLANRGFEGGLPTTN